MRCAVVGDPIAHSRSPALHRAAYAACGLDWTYDAVRVPAGELPGFVRGLDEGWRGLSVTAPLKREAFELASAVSSTAALAGVANTLVHGDGVWSADNTDIPGAAAALRERWGGELSTVTILGGGATAASTGLALVGLGAERVRLLVRDPATAAGAKAALGRHPVAPSVEVASLYDAPVEGEVVVSTIPATAQTPDLVARCGVVLVVFEVVYHPWPTPLAASVLAEPSVGDGRVLVTGLDLLLHQAALQFTAFTGLPAPLDAMRAAL